jgi:prevent-host-death family protein
MAGRRYSVAEARQSFARLIRAAERGRAVEITRRGEPVAVLLSASKYLALTGERPSFVDRVAAVRARLDVDQLGIGDEEFAGLREESAGREVFL